MNLWDEKTVWLTGASSGIGEALVYRLAKSGSRLAITARRTDLLDQIVNKLNSGPDKIPIISYPGDVTDREEMNRIVREIESDWDKLDILIANAGTYTPTDPLNFNSVEYESIMRINYQGVLNCIESVLPGMLTRGKGQIVGISSLTGYRGLPKAAAYGASKAALINFLESIRFDLEKKNIQVTIVNPGFVRTAQTDKNEFQMPYLLEPEEAAEYIIRGIEKGKKEIHFPPFFSWTMKFLRLLPYPLYEFIIRSRVYR